MIPVTIEHRKQELRTLLGQIRTHPSQDWSHARQRVVILQRMIANAVQQQASG